MKVAFLTLGCKVNHYETEVMAQTFERAGDLIVPFEEKADVYVVNTCTVTATGDKKSRQALRAAKRQNPNAVVVAVGCYAQMDPDALLSMPEVDFVLGNLHKPELPALLRRHLEGAPLPPVDDIGLVHDFEPMSAVRSDRTRAIIKIQDGCNNFCSYCVIPYARGRIRSKPPQDVLREFETLVSEGYREIILTGIEIASYGGGKGETFTLPELLELLCAHIPGQNQLRIRLGSLEPRIVTEPFASFLAAHPAICPQFHLSLQSGCDEVLARMNRKYDTARYTRSVQLLRQYLPKVMLTTDIVVGFPGETEQQFLQTVEYVTATRFLKVHAFPYSPRKGTPAAVMSGQLGGPEKARRVKALSTACDAVRHDILASQTGNRYLMLAEDCKNGVYRGYTENYLPVHLEAAPGLSGQLLPVVITGLQGDTLSASLSPSP